MPRRNIRHNLSFASHPKAKYWSDENELKPWQVRKNSGKKFKFDCPTCGHTFEAAPSNIRNGRWCGFCGNQRLCDNRDCDVCSVKSFASHPGSKNWSNENELKPWQVFKGSTKKYIFDCPECLHSSVKSPNQVVYCDGCVFCAGQRLCSNEDCDECYNKSFAISDMAKYWSDKNKLTPRDVSITSSKKCRFDCNVCDHTFDCSLANIARGNFCPYCANSKLCTNDDCDACRNNSFESCPRSDHWSSKNKVSPRQVFKGSIKKYEFNCPYCNQIYKATLNSVTKGSWCNCKCNKTETLLFEYLQSILDCKVVHQKKFK